jgi:nicotinic acid mononucleotide adenylyltransferase
LAVAARGTASQSAPSETTRFEFENHPQARVVRLNFPLMPVSATEIRQHLAQSGLEPTGLTSLISPSVASYIAQHQLYKAA